MKIKKTALRSENRDKSETKLKKKKINLQTNKKIKKIHIHTICIYIIYKI